MAAPVTRSVTKGVLAGFVREHSALNLTQSKAIADRLLNEFIVTPKQPADPSAFPVEPGQLWLHRPSNKVLRVCDIESGPIHVPGDPVTPWGPQSVSWEDAADSSVSGSTGIDAWRLQAAPLSVAGESLSTAAHTEELPPSPSQESETIP